MKPTPNEKKETHGKADRSDKEARRARQIEASQALDPNYTKAVEDAEARKKAARQAEDQ